MPATRIALALAGTLLAGAASARDTLASAHESNGPAIVGADRRSAAAERRREHERLSADALEVVAESRQNGVPRFSDRVMR